MRNRLPCLVALALLAGCGTVRPEPAPAVRAADSPDATFDCAMRLLNEKMYVIAAADRASGFIQARRQPDHQVLDAANRFERLTVTLFPSAQAVPMIRVVPDMELAADSKTSLSYDEHSVMAALFAMNRRASPTELSQAIRDLRGLGMSVGRLYLVVGDLAARGFVIVLNERATLGTRTLKRTSVGLAPRGAVTAARCAREWALIAPARMRST